MINKLTVLTMTTVLAGAAFAQSPEERGMEIALETERRDSGFGDYVVEGNMLLQSPDGGSGQRRFSMYTLEIESDGDKRLVEFHQPRDLEGMISLTFSHGLEADDQWLYLPALRRTKRLAARDKTGSFAGSEFSFEDIGTPSAMHLLRQLSFPTQKPPAHVSLDDRAITFTGLFPDLEILRAFKPWNKQ